ncbi:class I SAM-dependent methyltransferase [Pelagibacteraceae bacterium]|nr:class I SAM-dependent methyltransferase [Pelagibacteraceae bacterium]MDC0529992.1 class I SAM-dependent methyltransferase [Pelagibacteraceae bacterium]MDC0952815.1 class I SAM-dependent methyltransferase [Pelagibacteraceae bacterium]
MGKDLDINNKIQTYIQNLSQPLHPIQKEIIAYNETLGDIKRMQISVSQCHFLHLIIKTCNAKNILEIGTFTGLSTLSMSLALSDEGSIIALDKNLETNKIALDFFNKANQSKKIKTIVKPALDSLNDIKKENILFDIVFIDADKTNYTNYYESVIQLIKKDGLIIIDNVLWHGEVADENNNEKFTNIIREFNTHVKNDNRVEQIILPIGDGLTVCRKL